VNVSPTKPIHPMSKKSTQNSIPSCGCKNCLCHRGPRCRCHDYNALLALALWDFGQMFRRHSK